MKLYRIEYCRRRTMHKFFYKLQKFNTFKYRPFKVKILLKQKAKLKINEVLNFYPVFDLNFTVDLI